MTMFSLMTTQVACYLGPKHGHDLEDKSSGVASKPTDKPMLKNQYWVRSATTTK